MINPRKIAVQALLQVDQSEGYSNLVLDAAVKSKEISQRDKALATALFYGVLERKISLDYIISQYAKNDIRKIPPFTLECLRLGIYQLKFMDKIPDSAAVNETVKLVKDSREKYASGFVNAVLRNIQRNDIRLPEDNSVNSLSIKYSCPVWLIESLIADYGLERAIAFLEDSLKSPPQYIRVNTLLSNENELIKEFENIGITAEGKVLPGALCVRGLQNIEYSHLFNSGLFHVQDLSSQICAAALDCKPGQRVLDLCAAPGGKSFTIAQHMNNTGELISCDLHQNRLGLIKEGAKRLKLSNIKVLQNDATQFNPAFGEFDRVLCDVPCSGFGIIRRKPEIKYKSREDVDGICDIQYKILSNAVKYLIKGGRLIYSTCTLRKAENEQVCEKLLGQCPDIEYDSISIEGIAKGISSITLFPEMFGSDGFFIAAFKRI
ncbi:MAG TPA: 16S rRNA (cytosine(967)-C(5))-methyltransferase RsmB [Clostridiales bacterium]|nr:16S rRNA (cytosine(967)-C(5))-methyltransferase RsmB [Clostridiales bacterium]